MSQGPFDDATTEFSRLLDALDACEANRFPYPVARCLALMKEVDNWSARRDALIAGFEALVKFTALICVAQYLIHDSKNEDVDNPRLNDLLLKSFLMPALGTWVNVLFEGLRPYADGKSPFRIEEALNIVQGRQKRGGPRAPFVALVAHRNDVYHSPIGVGERGAATSVVRMAPHMAEIVRKFDFLAKYEFIFVAAAEEASYRATVFNGPAPIGVEKSIESPENLEVGAFYLLGPESGCVVAMHPLTVFYESTVPYEGSDLVGEPVTYQRLLSSRVDYVGPCLAIIHDRSVFAEEMRRLLDDNLEGHRIREPGTVSWPLVYEVSSRISERYGSFVRQKYDRATHVPRTDVVAEIRAFAASDDTCFVLGGESGTGKSSLLCELEEGLRDDGHIVLLYDATKFPTDVELSATIGQQLNRHLGIADGARGDFDALLTKLDATRDGRQLFLLLDGANEHPRSSDLVERIDAMVLECLVPWVKVVVTTRTHAWSTMIERRRLSLAHYRQGDDENLGIALAMKRFSPDELGDAWSRRNLKPDIDAIGNPEMMAALRDPLLLKIVADTYEARGGEVPTDLDLEEIYRAYLLQTVDGGDLRRRRLTYFQKEVVPLFVDLAVGTFRNVLDGEAIVDGATARSGDSLYEWCTNSDLMTDGVAVNATFRVLCDANVLYGKFGYASEIGFKYERFFDLFVAEEMSAQTRRCEGGESRRRLILESVAAVKAHPFMAGPVERLIVEALGEASGGERDDLLFDLASHTEETTRGLIIAALGEFSDQQPGAAERMLVELLDVGATDGKDVEALGIAARTAVEVGSRTGSVAVMDAASRHPDEGVRDHAIVHAYYMWQSHPGATLSLLSRMRERIEGRHWYRPDLVAAKATLTLAAVILVNQSRHPQVLEKVLGMLRKAIAQVLWSGETRSRGQRLIAPLFRRIAVWMGVQQIVKALRVVPKHNHVCLAEFDHFFACSEEQKDALRRSLPLLDPDSEIDEALESGSLVALGRHSTFHRYLQDWILTVHAIRRFDAVAPSIERLAREGNGYDRYVLTLVMHKLTNFPGRETNEQELALYRTVAEHFFEENRGWFDSHVERYRLPPHHHYFATRYRYDGSCRTSLHDWCLERAGAELRDGRTDLLEFCIDCRGLNSEEMKEYGPALVDFWERCVVMAADAQQGGEVADRLLDVLVDNLNRLNACRSDVVDLFLANPRVPRELRQRINPRTGGDSIEAMLEPMTAFLVAGVYRDPAIRSFIQAAAESASRAPSTKRWFDGLLRKTANALLQEDVFSVTPDRWSPTTRCR